MAGGQMKTNSIPHILPEEKKTGLYTTGDNQNSWAGVTILQELQLYCSEDEPGVPQDARRTAL